MTVSRPGATPTLPFDLYLITDPSLGADLVGATEAALAAAPRAARG